MTNGFKSRRAIISEAGGDIEDTFEEIAADNQLAESKGVELGADRSDPSPIVTLNKESDEHE